MPNFSISRPVSHICSAAFPSANVELANRIKQGRCTRADQAKINTFLGSPAAPSSQEFSQNPTVLRKLIKALLDGKISDPLLIDYVKQFKASLTLKDKIRIIESRQAEISELTDAQAAKIGFVFKFLDDSHLSQSLRNSITVLKPIQRASDLGSETKKNFDYGTDPTEGGYKDEDRAGIDTAEFNPFGNDFLFFESIAQRIFDYGTDPTEDSYKAEDRAEIDAAEFNPFGNDFLFFESIAQRISDYGTDPTEGSYKAEDRAGIDTAKFNPFLSFESIAQRIVGSMPSYVDMLLNHAYFVSNKHLAQLIAYNKFSDAEKQKLDSILSSDKGRAPFFDDPVVQNILLQAWIENVDMDPRISVALQNCKPNLSFSDQEKIHNQLSKLLNSPSARLKKEGMLLHFLVNISPEIQKNISQHIISSQFGTDPTVLQVVAKNLAVFIDPQAQRNIASAIFFGRFGTDPAVFQAVARNLAVFTDPEAQTSIASAIQQRKFGTDQEVLKTVFQTLIGIPFYYRTIALLLPSLSLTHIALSEKRDLLNQIKFSLGLPNNVGHIPEDDLLYLFGAKAYSGSDAIQQINAKLSGIDGIDTNAIADAFDDNKQYALQIDTQHQRVILYPLTQDQGDFRGWLNSDNKVLYKQCVKEITILDFANLRDGYPTQIDGKDLHPAHALFGTLPAYLQYAIQENSFNLASFRHQAIIRLVTETLIAPLIEQNSTLAHKMQAIMQSSIVASGDFVRIASTNEEDAAIKSAINALCGTPEQLLSINQPSEIMRASKAAINNFFNLPSTTTDDKAKVAVLLGTMAKQGVLGYHHSNANQANNLLYLLARSVLSSCQILMALFSQPISIPS